MIEEGKYFMLAWMEEGKIEGLAAFVNPGKDGIGELYSIASAKRGAGSKLLCCALRHLAFPFAVKPASQTKEWWDKKVKEHGATLKVLDSGSIDGWIFTPPSLKAEPEIR